MPDSAVVQRLRREADGQNPNFGEDKHLRQEAAAAHDVLVTLTVNDGAEKVAPSALATIRDFQPVPP